MARDNEPGMTKPKKQGTSGSGRWSSYKSKEPVVRLDWGEVNSALLASAIGEAVNGGDALLFGASRDGGVLVLTVCSGDERLKLYAKSIAEADELLNTVIKQY